MTENEKSDMDFLQDAYSELCKKLVGMTKTGQGDTIDKISHYLDVLDKMEKLTCLGPASVYWMRDSLGDCCEDICEDCREAMEESGEGGVEA